MSFARKIVNNTSFALLDLLLTKVGTTIAFVLLVRLLPETDIAALGIATGYLVFAAYLEVGPIRVLLRDYPTVSQDQRVRDELLTALFGFWLLQSIAILLLALGLNQFVLGALGLPELPFLFLGLVIDFIALSWQDWIKTVYYADFRQAAATRLGFVLSLLRLACYLLLLVEPSLTMYAWILIGTSVLNCVVWAVFFQASFHYRPVVTPQLMNTLKASLASYGLWDHVNRMVIDTLFTIDTVILSWVAISQLADIGDYTIALKITSLLFIIPSQLRRSLQLALAHRPDERQQTEAVSTFLKANALVSLGQLVGIIVAGPWLIDLLFGAETDPNVFRYMVVIAIGVAVMNLAMPLIGVINTLCSLRKASMQVFLPLLVLGVGVYVVAALLGGAWGIAMGNIVVYTLLASGLVLFTVQHYPFSRRLPVITGREKQALQNLLR